MNDNEIAQKLNRIYDLYENYDYASVLVLSFDLIKNLNEQADSEVLIEIYHIISKIYFNKSDYIRSYEYAIKASELMEEFQSIELALENIICISKLLLKQSAYDEAIQVLKRGLKKANKYNEPKYEAMIFNCLGLAYYGLKEYDKSIKVIENALDIIQEITNGKLLHEIKLNLAKAYIALGVYNAGQFYLEQVMAEIKGSESYIELVEAYLLEANIAYEKDNYEDTIDFAKKAKNISKRLELDYELLLSYEWLHKAYSKLNDFQKAYYAVKNQMIIHNNIFNKENNENLAKMRIKYDITQKAKEIKILQKNYDNAIKQKKELKYIVDIMGKQNEDLLEIAINDYLTGAYNRKYFILKLEEEFSIAEEYNRDLSCIIFDIDKFKLINDTYGHLAGDMVIKHIVQIFTDNVEENDIIGRFGGDEFVVILIGKKIDYAKNLANDVLNVLRYTPVIVNDDKIYTSISIGITDNKIGYPKNGEDMIRIADKALYKAKESGRDQMCISC